MHVLVLQQARAHASSVDAKVDERGEPTMSWPAKGRIGQGDEDGEVVGEAVVEAEADVDEVRERGAMHPAAAMAAMAAGLSACA